MDEVLVKRGASCFESDATGCGREELGSEVSTAEGGSCLESPGACTFCDGLESSDGWAGLVPILTRGAHFHCATRRLL